jgi:glucosamine--fructose-6-phosphate aminotransferase (isomerizing)
MNDLIFSLERLEYRGYDSAGIAYLGTNSKLYRERAVGKIENLKEVVEKLNVKSNIGIGHTRWATHGKVTELNAHPHVCDGVAVVHNGIIENYQELKDKLITEGYVFESETDTEVISKLIAFHIKGGENFQSAFSSSLSKFVGTYAIVAICENEPNILLGAKMGSPMAIGLSNDQQNFHIASDAVALSSLTDKVTYLEEGDIVVAEKGKNLNYEIFNLNGEKVARDAIPNVVSLNDINQNGYESFMLKEIFEEVIVAKNTYDRFNCDIDIFKFRGISIIACGTSYYAGLLAKYWIEDIARIPVNVEIASEFRYKNPILPKDSLYVFVSQSGETIDTLCAMRLVKEAHINTVALVNVNNSSIAREADYVIQTVAGTEIGVASTKVFISQILSMLLMCVKKDSVDITTIEKNINIVLNKQHEFARIAEKIKNSRSLFYIGRGTNYPLSLEGALKIKELSYISAEGHPAGEIKHGPIAIVDESVHTIAIAPLDKHFKKTLSNSQEIFARNGKILLITTENARNLVSDFDKGDIDYIFLPNSDPLYYPFSITTAIHLVAYYTAKLKGGDVDKPRNLAKSVTVE